MRNQMRLASPIGMVLLAILVVGCMGPAVNADMRLTEVRRPADVSERWGDYEIEEAEKGLAYEDELIRAVTIPTNRAFTLIVENKTKHSLQLLWDQMSFVSPEGSASKVTSGETKVMNVGESQPPTPIPANANVTVMAIPNAVIYDSDGDGIDDVNRLFTAADTTRFEEIKGKTVRLILPLKVEDTVNEYTFVFSVEDLKVEK